MDCNNNSAAPAVPLTDLVSGVYQLPPARQWLIVLQLLQSCNESLLSETKTKLESIVSGLPPVDKFRLLSALLPVLSLSTRPPFETQIPSSNKTSTTPNNKTKGGDKLPLRRETLFSLADRYSKHPSPFRLGGYRFPNLTCMWQVVEACARDVFSNSATQHCETSGCLLCVFQLLPIKGRSWEPDGKAFRCFTLKEKPQDPQLILSPPWHFQVYWSKSETKKGDTKKGDTKKGDTKMDYSMEYCPAIDQTRYVARYCWEQAYGKEEILQTWGTMFQRGDFYLQEGKLTSSIVFDESVVDGSDCHAFSFIPCCKAHVAGLLPPNETCFVSDWIGERQKEEWMFHWAS